jgi:MgsA AAA+ ATPase C terminal
MVPLSNDLFQSEVETIDHSRALDAIEPLRCDRWVAFSAMQKSIRRGDGLTAQRALRTLYQHDPSSAWRRLLIIACEDVGIGALGAVVMTARRSANVKALREMGRDQAAALATAQMLAEAPKDRSADLLFAVALHGPALETTRSRCRSVSVARRLEFVADPTLSLPERALAVWFSSGIESRGERRVGLGDLDALMRTYGELGVPERLLQAVGVAIKKAREPFALLLPLLWLAAAGSETGLADSPLAPSGLINGVPLCALDKHTRFGRQAIRRFAQENAEIAQFLTERGRRSSDDGALRMAVFYADGALTRPTLQWRHSAELTAAGVAADFHGVHVDADVGAELVELVAAHIAHLDAIRSRLLSRALPPNR